VPAESFGGTDAGGSAADDDETGFSRRGRIPGAQPV